MKGGRLLMTSLPSTVRLVAAMAALGAPLRRSLAPSGYRAAVASSVGGGALVAAIALGVVLTYRSSGVVNFANAATATYAAVPRSTACSGRASCSCRRCRTPCRSLEGLMHAVPGRRCRCRTPDSLAFGAPLTFGAAFALSLVIASVAGTAHAPAGVPPPAPRPAAGQDGRLGRPAPRAPVRSSSCASARRRCRSSRCSPSGPCDLLGTAVAATS